MIKFKCQQNFCFDGLVTKMTENEKDTGSKQYYLHAQYGVTYCFVHMLFVYQKFTIQSYRKKGNTKVI